MTKHPRKHNFLRK